MSRAINAAERKILILASLGGMLEFYDFTIYGFFSLYFAEQFFPTTDKFVAIMLSYTVFVIGYIARPIGGILFSHLGDVIGRKLVLIVTMLIMGIASLGIGIVPVYSQIGIFAPILLLVLRLSQGLAIGGEIPGTVVYVTEYMPHKSGFAIGCVMAGVGSGLLLGALVNVVLSSLLSIEQIHSYGWRIPFLLGGVLCGVSYVIRKQLHDVHTLDKISRSAAPLLTLFKKYPKLLVSGVGVGAIAGSCTMLILVFMPTYLVDLAKIENSKVADLLLVANALMMLVSYLFGILADKYNRYTVMRLSLFFAILATSVCYYLISQHLAIVFAVLCLATLPGIFATMVSLLVSHLFPAEIRLTGVALSYNLGHTIFGGLAPIIITWLIHNYGWVALAPIGYFLIVIMIALSACYFCQQQDRRDYTQTDLK
jgi:MFS family permease